MNYFYGTPQANLSDCACSGGRNNQLTGYHRGNGGLRGLRSSESEKIAEDIRGLQRQYSTTTDPQRQRQIQTTIGQKEAELRRAQEREGMTYDSAGYGGNGAGAGQNEQSWWTQKTIVDSLENWQTVGLSAAAAAAVWYFLS